MASASIRIALVLWVLMGFFGISWAQTGYMVQGGSVARGHAAVAVQSGAPGAAIYGDGGPALAGAFTEIGISASGTPLCINDVVPSSPGEPPNGPYHQLCFGANSLGGGLISYNAYNGATPLTLTCVINGSSSPCFGSGVVGQSPTQVGQIASFKNTAGTLIGEGAAGIKDIYSGAVPAIDGATLTIQTDPSITASQIYGWVYLPPGMPGTGYYDAVRGVAVLTPGSTATLVNGVAGYVLSDTPASVGNVPTSVAVFGVAAAVVANAAVWGSNFISSDNEGQAISSTTGISLYGTEDDFNVTSPHTNVFGFIAQGASLSQPNSAVGHVCGPLSFAHPAILWTSCFQSDDGAASLALNIGLEGPSPGAGTGSQFIRMNYNDSSSVERGGVIQTSLEAGNGGGTASFAINNTDPTRSMGLGLINGGFWTGDSALVTNGIILGAQAASGSNVQSQVFAWRYYDSAGAAQNYSFQVSTSQILDLNSTTSPTTFSMNMVHFLAPHISSEAHASGNACLGYNAATGEIYVSTTTTSC